MELEPIAEKHIKYCAEFCQVTNVLEYDDRKKLPTGSGVYLFVRNGVVEYVGIAKNLKERVRKHKWLGKYDDQKILVLVCLVEYWRNRLETMLIAGLDPKLNTEKFMKGSRRKW